jgi:hypothetical protein
MVIGKKREMFGPRSERSQRLIDQMELQLEELAAAAGEDDAKAVQVQGSTRRQATRRNFPADLPRRRIVLRKRSARWRTWIRRSAKSTSCQRRPRSWDACRPAKAAVNSKTRPRSRPCENSGENSGALLARRKVLQNRAS